MSFNTALLIAELVALVLAIGSVPSVLIERRARPTAATVWLLLFLFVPFAGVLLWWSIGRLYMRRRRRRRRRAKAEVVSRLANVRAQLRTAQGTGPHFAVGISTAREQARNVVFLESDRVFASRRGNHIRIFEDANTAYPAFLAAIAAARKHIHFQFYIYEADETGRLFRDALVAAARRGVEVRVLVDAVGGGPVAGEFMDALREAGGHFVTFMPMRLLRRRLTVNFRNHRKILVVDGRMAFTGGINIGDEYTHDWHDFALQLEGPVIDQLQEVFAEDWFFATGYSLATNTNFGCYEAEGPLPVDLVLPPAHPARCRVVASGPDMPENENATFQIFFLACTTAHKRVFIMTPYFIPDQAMLVAVTSAARRGVDVRLLVPQRSDVPFVQLACRSYYEDLLTAGVKVFEYRPAVLHAKMLLFDDDWVILGSANVDIRSFRLNFEASIFTEGEALNADLVARFERDQEDSDPVSLEAVRAQSWQTRIKQAAAHLFSPML